MANSSYAWEKLFIAVNILAAGKGDIGSRLREAWEDSLSFASFEDHWPNLKLFEKFKELQEDFEFVSPLLSGLTKTSDDEIVEFIKRIVALQDRVARTIGM